MAGGRLSAPGPCPPAVRWLSEAVPCTVLPTPPPLRLFSPVALSPSGAGCQRLYPCTQLSGAPPPQVIPPRRRPQPCCIIRGATP